MAQLIGAAPRYSGSSEACRLMPPSAWSPAPRGEDLAVVADDHQIGFHLPHQLDGVWIIDRRRIDDANPARSPASRIGFLGGRPPRRAAWDG